MPKAPSTSNISQAKCQETPGTSYFLFREEDVPVVVRGPAQKPEAGLQSNLLTTNSSADVEGRQTRSLTAMRARVPETRVLGILPGQRYILLKKYEGFVTARREDSFSARLFENSSDYPVIEAEFAVEELSETDRVLAVEGAPMVWTIGYAYDGSTRKRESLIYLRRLPPLSDRDLAEGRKDADNLTSGIPWE